MSENITHTKINQTQSLYLLTNFCAVRIDIRKRKKKELTFETEAVELHVKSHTFRKYSDYFMTNPVQMNGPKRRLRK